MHCRCHFRCPAVGCPVRPGDLAADASSGPLGSGCWNGFSGDPLTRMGIGLASWSKLLVGLISHPDDSHAFLTPPRRLAPAAGMSQYRPPPALRRKVSPATPTSTAVVVLGENLST